MLGREGLKKGNTHMLVTDYLMYSQYRKETSLTCKQLDDANALGV